jgi:hypothetical protein
MGPPTVWFTSDAARDLAGERINARAWGHLMLDTPMRGAKRIKFKGVVATRMIPCGAV